MPDRRKLTAAELKQLAPYETNMQTAVESDWTRGIGRRGILLMKEIREAVTGRKQHVNGSCPSCVLNLVREVGRWYFADKAAKRKKAPKVAPKEAPAEPSEAPVEEPTTAPVKAAVEPVEAPGGASPEALREGAAE